MASKDKNALVFKYVNPSVKIQDVETGAPTIVERPSIHSDTQNVASRDALPVRRTMLMSRACRKAPLTQCIGEPP